MADARKIGILTSGGDCAGLNAVIRAAVHRAEHHGWQVIGIEDGTQGLLSRPVRSIPLDLARVDGTMMRQGGTILGTTNKGDPFAWPRPDGSRIDRSGEIIEGLALLGIDALIGIGGDGSMAILRRLALQGGFRLIGIPKTIDNDLGITERSIGFDTAVAVATEALDRLQPTAASHDRVMVLEVMGRDAGHIALSAGIAGGADVILMPEVPWSVAGIAGKINSVRQSGRNFALVVVSEAVKTVEGGIPQKEFADGQKRHGGIGNYIGHLIEEATGAETRVTVLGHVQRGCPPSHNDRLLASAFGVRAVDLIAEGQSDRLLAWSNRRIIDIPIAAAIETYAAVDLNDTLVSTARGLGIYFGDLKG
jgi:ATP-dependent phosphofructokinase / diphosphate-dependent phosphofructokinase